MSGHQAGPLAPLRPTGPLRPLRLQEGLRRCRLHLRLGQDSFALSHLRCLWGEQLWKRKTRQQRKRGGGSRAREETVFSCFLGRAGLSRDPRALPRPAVPLRETWRGSAGLGMARQVSAWLGGHPDSRKIFTRHEPGLRRVHRRPGVYGARGVHQLRRCEEVVQGPWVRLHRLRRELYSLRGASGKQRAKGPPRVPRGVHFAHDGPEEVQALAMEFQADLR